MRYCFIINPAAGKVGGSDKLIEEINSVCGQRGEEYEIFVSDTVQHTYSYVSESVEKYSDGEIEFIACGGDGTICKTVSAIMALPEERRSHVSIGIIPAGTGNDFVSNFKGKKNFLNIEAQLDARPYDIDLLYCNDHYSVNMVNVGFDSHVAYKKDKVGRKKLLPRKLAYIYALVLTLIKKPGVHINTYDGEGKKIQRQLLLTTFANGAFCGGGFKSNPLASLTDGNIDCLEVNNIGRLKFISLVGKYKKGEHICKRFEKILSHKKCRSAHLHFSEEVPVSIDGEIICTNELHLSVAQKVLRVMLPKGVKPTVDAIEANEAVGCF